MATRSDGTTDSQSVNAMGQVIVQSGAGLIASTFGYDTGTGQLNDLKLYPSGNTSSSSYEETKWGFDPATGAQTSMTYAGSGSGTDTINYKYNGAQLGQVSGEGVTTALGYNTAGEQNKTAVDDGSQTVTTNVTSQDDQGNPTSISVSTKNDGTGGAVTTSATDSFTYQNGNIANEIQSFVGVTTHSDYYPATGGGTGSSPNALKDVILIQNGVATSSTAYQYDSVSGRLQTIWVNSQLPAGMTLAALQASPSTLFSGSYFGVDYLPSTNLVHTISAGGAQTAWNYFPSGSGSATGDLSSVITTTQNGTTTLDSNTYTYNTNDQMQTATVAQATNTSSINYTQTYGYDAMDELNSVEGSGDSNSYSYAYDGVGNRTGNSTLGSANSLNEFADKFTYNARGDVTNDGTYAYTWNAADQVTAVVANNNSIKDTFQYDGENRRIEKDVYCYAGGAWQLQYARKFVYAGTNLVAELDGNGNEITGYTWSPQGLMAVTDYSGSTPTVYLAMLDGQGNVVGLANGSNGVVSAAFTYDPYGALLSATGPAANVCNVLYKQGYTDREVGLNYFKARYEKWVGIWLSRDAAGINGGSNIFVYCGNDPINEVDSSGTTPLPNETLESCVNCHRVNIPDGTVYRINGENGRYGWGVYENGKRQAPDPTWTPKVVDDSPQYRSFIDMFGLPGVGGDTAVEYLSPTEKTVVNVPLSMLSPGWLIEGGLNGSTDFNADRDGGASVPRALLNATGKNTPFVGIGWRIGEATAGHRVGGLNDGQTMTFGEQLMPFGEFLLLKAFTPRGRVAGGKLSSLESGGAARALKYGENWQNVSLDRAIELHAGSKYTSWVARSGKVIFENPETGRQVVYDLKGNYFRIFQPNSIGGQSGTYLNMNGRIPMPVRMTANGPRAIDLRSLPKGTALYNAETHFLNSDFSFSPTK